MPTQKRNTLACGFAEDDIIAEALGETPQALRQKVHSHLTACLRLCAAPGPIPTSQPPARPFPGLGDRARRGATHAR